MRNQAFKFGPTAQAEPLLSHNAIVIVTTNVIQNVQVWLCSLACLEQETPKYRQVFNKY